MKRLFFAYLLVESKTISNPFILILPSSWHSEGPSANTMLQHLQIPRHRDQYWACREFHESFQCTGELQNQCHTHVLELLHAQILSRLQIH